MFVQHTHNPTFLLEKKTWLFSTARTMDHYSQTSVHYKVVRYAQLLPFMRIGATLLRLVDDAPPSYPTPVLLHCKRSVFSYILLTFLLY